MRSFVFVFGCGLLGAIGCGGTTSHRPAADAANASMANSETSPVEDATKSRSADRAIDSLEGTWGIVSAESEGEPLLFSLAEIRYTYEGHKVQYESDNRRIKFEVTIDAQVDPPHHDIRAGDSVEQGIYRLDGDFLTLCSTKSPLPRPHDFTTAPGDGRTMMAFRRMHLDKLDQPVSKAEAGAFSQKIEKAARDGDAAAVNALIDLEGILDRTTKGLDIPESQRLSFIYGLRSNSQTISGGPASMGAKIAQTIRDGGIYRTLRIISDASGWRVLCRLVPAPGGLNYQEFLLGRDAFGNVVAADVFIFATGDLLSTLQFRGLLPSLAAMSPSIVSRVSASDRDYIQSGNQVRDYVVSLQDGKMDEAERIYQRLPQSVRSEKWLLLARLNKATDQDRPRALQECLSLHPEEPAFALLAIEDAINRANKDEVFQNITRLEKRVGNDPYLNLLRATVCERTGDLDGSRRFTEAATSAEPELHRLVQQAAHRE